MTDRCPATTRHIPPHSLQAFGAQCKYAKGHDGDHCGSPGLDAGDVFWPQETTTVADPDDEARIREALAEASDYPGRIITR